MPMGVIPALKKSGGIGLLSGIHKNRRARQVIPHNFEKTLRNAEGGIEPPRHFRTTGFPGLRPTARLPQEKVYPICMPGIFLMVSLVS